MTRQDNNNNTTNTQELETTTRSLKTIWIAWSLSAKIAMIK